MSRRERKEKNESNECKSVVYTPPPSSLIPMNATKNVNKRIENLLFVSFWPITFNLIFVGGILMPSIFSFIHRHSRNARKNIFSWLTKVTTDDMVDKRKRKCFYCVITREKGSWKALNLSSTKMKKKNTPCLEFCFLFIHFFSIEIKMKNIKRFEVKKYIW